MKRAPGPRRAGGRVFFPLALAREQVAVLPLALAREHVGLGHDEELLRARALVDAGGLAGGLDLLVVRSRLPACYLLVDGGWIPRGLPLSCVVGRRVPQRRCARVTLRQPLLHARKDRWLLLLLHPAQGVEFHGVGAVAQGSDDLGARANLFGGQRRAAKEHMVPRR